ncbi:MAG: glycosyltransferase [Candidatus Hydrogenedens sp.]
MFPPIVGGIEKFIFQSIQEQKQWAKITVIICSRNIHSFMETKGGVDFIYVGEWGRLLSTPISPLFPFYIKSIKPDLFVVHTPNPLGELSVLITQRKIPYVVRYHSDVVRQKIAMKFYAPFFYNFLKKAKLIIPTSDIYANNSPFLRSFLDKCRTVPLGIDFHRFLQSNTERVKAIQMKYGTPFVFFCGVHRYYKGIHILLKCSPYIKVPIVIAGDGPERKHLEEMAKSTDKKNIYFVGKLTDEDLVQYLHACSIFVFPSIARSEAFGLSIIEAHSAGKPVVATKLGTGVEWANLDGITGINVPPNNEHALAQAIQFLLDNEDIREAMGKTAKERVQSEFDIKVTAPKEFDLYRSVIG